MEPSGEKPGPDPGINTKGLVRIEAEEGQAQYALVTAAEILIEAKQMADDAKFQEAIALSRDSIRMASSAILFNDGFVASDLDSSISYLASAYGKKVPVSDWKMVEDLSRVNLVDRLGAIFGLNKGQQEKNSKSAIELAKKFIEAAGEIVGPIPEDTAPEPEEGQTLEQKAIEILEEDSKPEITGEAG